MNENNLWLERWENKEIGFNQNKPNPFLVQYFEALSLDKGKKILVPLCGKTIDISWILAQGYSVVGIELSEKAVQELFEELKINPSISKEDELLCYSAKNLKVFVGDIFKVTAQLIGKVDATYDRAALVALTEELREKYSQHIREISQNAPQLLLCFEYDQSLMNRSPYSVDENEVKKHYGKHYNMQLLTRDEIVGGFKGKLPASDVVWLLK